MISLKAQKREVFGRRVKPLREKGLLPAVLYGEGIKESISLSISENEFEKVLKKAGMSSLIV